MKRQFLAKARVLLLLLLTASAVMICALPSAAQPRKSRGAAKQEAAAQEQAAAAALAAAIEEKNYTPEELKELADLSRDTKDYEGLVFALQKLAALDPNRFSIRLELGEALIELKNYPEAISALQTASSLIPSDEAPHRLLAKIYAAQGDEKLRGAHLVNAARLAQRNWENQYNLAVYYIGAKRIADAKKLLVRAMELNSASAPPKFEYGKLLLADGDVEGAFRMFDEAVLIEPEHAMYLVYYAYTASISLRRNIARDNLALALKAAPEDTDVLRFAARIELNSGNNPAAERHIRAALRYSPTDMRALEILGDVFAAEFKYKEACGAYMTVWEKAGYREELAYKLGTAFALDGKWKEAKPIFDAIALKDPNNGEILYRLTEVHCELGDLKQANGMLMLNRFGEIAKNAVWHKAGQGRIHEAKKDYDLALTAYRAAIIINPNNPHINAGVGRMLAKQGELDSAIVYFQTANTLEPGNIRHLLAIAGIRETKNEYGDAVELYEQIAVRNPSRTETYLSIANLKERQGDPHGAIFYLSRATRYSKNDVSILFKLGRLYQATEQYDLAINAYQTSVGRKPNAQNVEALKMIGEIYYTKLTNEKKALEYFKRYVKSGGKDNSVEFLIKRMTSKGS